MAPVDRVYYDLLGVQPTATADELSSAYKKTALRLHPDKGGSADEFKAMKSAYDVLRDPQKRKLYDSHGPAIVRAMDGEVLEPEVMLEVMMSVSKTASKYVLCAMPLVALILLFPAIALSLKWDKRIAWDWTLVFVPMWTVQLVVLLLILKFRSTMAQTVDQAFLDTEDEEERAENDERKRKVKKVFTLCAFSVSLLMVQEALLAAKLQGYTNASYFVLLVPYLAFEILVISVLKPFLELHERISTIQTADLMSDPATAALALPLWWGMLRICTAGLLAAKADGHFACSWMLCMTPMIVGAGLKLILSCRTKPRSIPENEEEDPSSGKGFGTACFAIAGWLSILLLAAGKLDGKEYSAFWVFSSFFFLVAILLCCCSCLACCGPIVLGAFLKQDLQEQEAARARQRASGEAQAPLNPAGASFQGAAFQQYSTMSPQPGTPV